MPKTANIASQVGSQIEDAVKAFIEPNLGTDFLSANAVKKLNLEEGKLSIELSLGFPIDGIKDNLQRDLEKHLLPFEGVEAVDISISWNIKSHRVQKGVKGIPEVKNIIAVASGKGGVGKSTVSVNLALALKSIGAKVGLLDADIYGPSQAKMSGANSNGNAKPDIIDDNKLAPILCHGLQTMSVAYLLEDNDTPLVWRGPMVTSALMQLFQETHWQDLDYLIIDLPPGTGDIQLTLAQKIPVSGSIIVTTPQDISKLDAKKALGMFRKVNIPVLGVVENMSTFTCPNCGHVEPIFGQGAGEQISEEDDLPLLASIPLRREIQEDVDKGIPSMVSEPEGEIAENFKKLAYRVSALLSLKERDYHSKFKNIVLQSS